MGKAAIIGIAIAGVVLILGLIVVATYALRQKRIAKEAVERTTNPFGNVLFHSFSPIEDVVYICMQLYPF